MSDDRVDVGDLVIIKGYYTGEPNPMQWGVVRKLDGANWEVVRMESTERADGSVLVEEAAPREVITVADEDILAVQKRVPTN
jgi:hypothetical protein